MTYKTSTENKALEIVNVKSLEGKVKQSMEAAGNKGAFGYIRGGSEDEWTLNENTSAFNKKQIMPRVLRGIDSADLRPHSWYKTKNTNYPSASCRPRPCS